MSGEQMGDLIRVREAMRGQIMDLNEEVEDLKREVTRSHSIIDEKQDEIRDLQDQIVLTNKEHHDFRVATLEEYQENIARKEEEIEKEVTRSDSAEFEVEKLQDEIGKLVADLQSMVESEIKLAEHVEFLEKSRNIFRDQNKTLRELVDALTVSLRHITQGVV